MSCYAIGGIHFLMNALDFILLLPNIPHRLKPTVVANGLDVILLLFSGHVNSNTTYHEIFKQAILSQNCLEIFVIQKMFEPSFTFYVAFFLVALEK